MESDPCTPNNFTHDKCCGISVEISQGCIMSKCPECGKRIEHNIIEMIHRGAWFEETLPLKQNYLQRFYGMSVLEACIYYRRFEFLESLISRDLVDRTDKKAMDVAITEYDTESIKKLKENGHVFDYQTTEHLIDEFPFLTFQEADVILRL